MVVKPLDSLTTVIPTTDRDTLRRAISTFEGRKGDYTPRTTFERNYMAQAPEAVEAARAQIVTAALRAIGVTLSEKKTGTPAIVLVSDGFARMRASRDVPANLLTAIRIANRADAAVYAFAPALTPPSGTGDAPVDPAFAALTALTAQTGGDLVAGISGLDSGLARMNRDLDAHYVLTYRGAHGGDGRFHVLQVGIKRQGALVRARTGYVAPLSAALGAAAATPPSSSPLRVLRRSSLIQSWAGIIPAASGRASVMVTWEPALPRPGAAPRGRAASIVISASTPQGTMLFDAAVAAVGAAPAAADVPDHATFEAPVGPLRIDMKILDEKGIVIDTGLARHRLYPRRARPARRFTRQPSCAHARPASSARRPPIRTRRPSRHGSSAAPSDRSFASPPSTWPASPRR